MREDMQGLGRQPLQHSDDVEEQTEQKGPRQNTCPTPKYTLCHCHPFHRCLMNIFMGGQFMFFVTIYTDDVQQSCSMPLL